MSTPFATSLRDPRYVASHRKVCARIFGEHIGHLRRLDGRPLEELAPQAGLTVEEWEQIEGGRLRLACEQVLMFGMVFHLGRSWVRYLLRVAGIAWGG